MKQNDNNKSFDNDLEMSLLECMSTFRNVVLNDGRLLIVSASIIKMNQEKTDEMEEDK